MVVPNQVSKQPSEVAQRHQARSTDNHAAARPSLAAASKKRMNLKKGKMQKSQIVQLSSQIDAPKIKQKSHSIESEIRLSNAAGGSEDATDILLFED